MGSLYEMSSEARLGEAQVSLAYVGIRSRRHYTFPIVESRHYLAVRHPDTGLDEVKSILNAVDLAAKRL